MSNYALTLRHERCPDGAEFEPHPWVEGTNVRYPMKRSYVADDTSEMGVLLPEDGAYPPVIRYRSKRREEYRRRLESPDDLIVTKFLNAVPDTAAFDEDRTAPIDYRALLNFVSEYGFPLPFISANQVREHLGEAKTPPEMKFLVGGQDAHVGVSIPGLEPSTYIPLHTLSLMRSSLEDIWNAYAERRIADVVDMFDAHSDEIFAGLRPQLQLREGSPALMLPAGSLYGFMLMETALVVSGGAQVMRCDNCGIIFVTGPGTGRRGSSKYCSNRCRVAAQRHEHGGDKLGKA